MLSSIGSIVSGAVVVDNTYDAAKGSLARNYEFCAYSTYLNDDEIAQRRRFLPAV